MDPGHAPAGFNNLSVHRYFGLIVINLTQNSIPYHSALKTNICLPSVCDVLL